MKSHHRLWLRDSEGKGLLGCLAFIVLLGIAIFLGTALVPVYFANSNLDSGVKTIASRAGAHYLDDNTIIKDTLDLARRQEIPLTRKNISLQRYANQIFIEVKYDVPVDLGITDYTLHFEIKASSIIGSL